VGSIHLSSQDSCLNDVRNTPKNTPESMLCV
jgi:hypothetical protein